MGHLGLSKLVIQYLWRLALIATCLTGVTRWALAERAYAAGMASADLQIKLDGLTEAGEWYPYRALFRQAQAKQLFSMIKTDPGWIDAALPSMSLAVDADPNYLELLSALFLMRRAKGDCDGADPLRGRIAALAPHSDVAKGIILLPCP